LISASVAFSPLAEILLDFHPKPPLVMYAAILLAEFASPLNFFATSFRAEPSFQYMTR